MAATEMDVRSALPDAPEFTRELIEEIRAEAQDCAREIDRQTAAMELLEREDLQVRLRWPKKRALALCAGPNLRTVVVPLNEAALRAAA